MTLQMHRICNTLQRPRPRRPPLFATISPTFDVTWADFMDDLDPHCRVGGLEPVAQNGETR